MFASVPRNETPREISLASRFGLSGGETLIATSRGEVAMSQLQLGDTVLTRDNGLQAIRRIATVSAHDQGAVIVGKDALGKGMPCRDITLSADHRVLVTGEIAAMLFDAPEALIAARHLIGLAGVSKARAHAMSQLSFDHDEVVLANGCWVEVEHSNIAQEKACGGVSMARGVNVITVNH